VLRIVGSERALKRYARKFVHHFLALAPEKLTVTLGHRGATTTAAVYWLERLGIWFYPAWTEGSYQHLFGLIRAVRRDRALVACEINFPSSGIDRRIGGAFAVDRKGQVYVIHRGHLGGKRGMGRSHFLETYCGVWADLDEGDTSEAVAVVGELNSPRFPRQVAQFVSQITLIKEGKTPSVSRQLLMPLEMDFGSDMRSGEMYEDLVRDLGGECDLGSLREDLAHLIASQGQRVKTWGTNILYYQRGEESEETYCYVCADNGQKSIREGAINLFFLTLRSRRRHRMYLFVPELLPRLLTERLAELHIETIVYGWQDDHATFPGFDV